MERECPPGTIRNPATGRCVKEDGPIGRRLRREPVENNINANRNVNRNRNDCPEGTIRNPATGRCVKIDGPIGRRLVAENTPRNEPPRSGAVVRGPGANDCPPGMIRNPATSRCVREDGPTGRRIGRRARIRQPQSLVDRVLHLILSNNARNNRPVHVPFDDRIRRFLHVHHVYNNRIDLPPVRVPSEDRIRRQFRTQNSIRRFLHERNEKHLQNISDQDLRSFLKKFAKKDIDGNRENLLKELENWNRSLLPKEKKTKQKKENSKEDSSEKVFDPIQMEDVPIKDFLKEDGHIILKRGKHTYGVYLERTAVKKNTIRLLTTSGTRFNIKRLQLLPLLQKGHNIFTLKTSSLSIASSKKEGKGFKWKT